MTYQKEKSRKNLICNCIKKNKIPRNKPTQEGKRLVLGKLKKLIKETEEDINRWKELVLLK